MCLSNVFGVIIRAAMTNDQVQDVTSLTEFYKLTGIYKSLTRVFEWSVLKSKVIVSHIGSWLVKELENIINIFERCIIKQSKLFFYHILCLIVFKYFNENQSVVHGKIPLIGYK